MVPSEPSEARRPTPSRKPRGEARDPATGTRNRFNGPEVTPRDTISSTPSGPGDGCGMARIGAVFRGLSGRGCGATVPTARRWLPARSGPRGPALIPMVSGGRLHPGAARHHTRERRAVASCGRRRFLSGNRPCPWSRLKRQQVPVFFPQDKSGILGLIIKIAFSSNTPI